MVKKKNYHQQWAIPFQYNKLRKTIRQKKKNTFLSSLRKKKKEQRNESKNE